MSDISTAWNVLRGLSLKLNFPVGRFSEIFVCPGFLELVISSFNMKTFRDGEPLLCFLALEDNLIRVQLYEMFLPYTRYAPQTVGES